MEQLTAFDSWCAPAHCFLGEPIFVPEPKVCVYVGVGWWVGGLVGGWVGVSPLV
jgi:hypothetical protein